MIRERRLLLVVGAIVFVDTMFYAAIAPILPALAHGLGLSKLSAGLLTAAYPVGTLVGSLPGGILAARAGPKTTVYVGLALLAGSTAAFGWLHNAALLDAARFIEGFGGACSWAGGLAWLVAQSPPERRGEAIGGALAAGIAGALFGPVIGAIASGAGRGPTFSAVVVLSVLLIDQVRRLPLTHLPSSQGLRDVARALGRSAVAVGMWLVVLPAIASGAINVLAPLRLHQLGADGIAIGAAFLAAAGCEALTSPLMGRLSDRRGRLLPLRFGLAGSALFLAIFTVPMSVWLLGGLVVMSSLSLAGFWAPAMALLSEAADASGLDQGLAAALINMAWALGQMMGAGGAGALAKAAGDAPPMILVSALCLLTLAAVGRRRGVPPRVPAAEVTGAATSGGPPGSWASSWSDEAG
ncbi:MAG TPA: MFS transporter [Solirubrobacteraceae bacterium]|nr:MFS transporter [Solirubrobacteraceae bacterium]